MFANFYNLSGLPFLLTPDTRFFFGSSGHSRAIAHLVYGLSQQEGFIVITGEVGAGKTTLVEQLWSQLDRKTYIMARVVTTQVSGDDLLRLVMANFGARRSAGHRQGDTAAPVRAYGARPAQAGPALPAGRGRGAEPVDRRARGTAHAVQHHGGRPSLRADDPAGPAAVPARSWRARTWSSCASACSPPTTSAR